MCLHSYDFAASEIQALEQVVQELLHMAQPPPAPPTEELFQSASFVFTIFHSFSVIFSLFSDIVKLSWLSS
jgi:hypothetical protein